MERRFSEVCHSAGSLMQRGLSIFSPIAHTHPIAVRCELPRDFDFWEAYDRVMIQNCEELWVLQMHGWTVSTGVKREVKLAEVMGKPVGYLTLEETTTIENIQDIRRSP